MASNVTCKSSVKTVPSLLWDLWNTEQQFLSGKRDGDMDLESAVRIFVDSTRLQKRWHTFRVGRHALKLRRLV